MNSPKMNKEMILKLTYAAALTALVVILQLMGSFIKFGMFSISAVLVPIVIGAAIGGCLTGAWLGFVFGVTVLLSGDAAAFLAIDVFGTIVTVLLKGTLCGFAAGIAYRLIARLKATVVLFVKKEETVKDKTVGALDTEALTEQIYAAASDPNSKKCKAYDVKKLAAVVMAALVCPLVNTGVFLLGTAVFFWDTVSSWAGSELIGEVIFFLIGFNWIFEIILNVVLVPVILRLLKLVKLKVA